MSVPKTKLNPERGDFDKLDGLEMVIVPKFQFLEFFKHVKVIVGEMDIQVNDDNDWME